MNSSVDWRGADEEVVLVKIGPTPRGVDVEILAQLCPLGSVPSLLYRDNG